MKMTENMIKIEVTKVQASELIKHMIMTEVHGNVKIDKDGIEIEDAMAPYVLGLLEVLIKSYYVVKDNADWEFWHADASVPEWMRSARRALKEAA